jgi:putative transposase
MSLERRRQMIAPEHPKLSVVRQCELVSISRSGFYYQPAGETPLNLELMRLIDRQFLETPWYGSRQMARHLRREGYTVGRKRIRRLMATMGLEPIYQRPRTTVPHPEHRVYPYLLREMVIERPNQVWCSDITYLPMRRGCTSNIEMTPLCKVEVTLPRVQGFREMRRAGGVDEQTGIRSA